MVSNNNKTVCSWGPQTLLTAINFWSQRNNVIIGQGQIYHFYSTIAWPRTNSYLMQLPCMKLHQNLAATKARPYRQIARSDMHHSSIDLWNCLIHSPSPAWAASCEYCLLHFDTMSHIMMLVYLL